MKRPGSASSKTFLIGSVFVMLATACNSSASPSASATAAAPSTVAATPLPSPSTVLITPPPIAAGPGPNGGTVVRWFIGLGGGTQPESKR